MSADSGQEKTEEATPKRQQEARRKGTVAKSIDLNNAVVMFGIALFAPLFLSQASEYFIKITGKSLRSIPDNLELVSMKQFVLPFIQAGLSLLAPVAATAMILGLIANFSQVGFTLSLEALKPSFEKINPMAGFKRLFSARSGVEALKTVVKSFLFAYIAWSVIKSYEVELIGIAWLMPFASLKVITEIIFKIMLRIAIVWLCIAALDYYFQRKQVSKSLRMTKDELKQEMKQQELSAELKAQQARRRRRLSRSRVREQVPKADAIITNPTHYAVAIKYERSKMHAPMVVAKGQDYLAFMIRQVAQENRVPIIPNPPLARGLYKKCEVGDYVPREFYQAVAEVLAYVYKTLQRIK